MKVVVGTRSNTTFSQVSERTAPTRISVGTTGAGVDPIARTVAGDAYEQANAAFSAANVANNGANTVQVFANGSLILSNSTLNFNNTATVNVAAAANGVRQSNLSFVVNTNAFVMKSGGTMTGALNVNSTLNVTQQIYANVINFGPYTLASNAFQTTLNSQIEVDSFPASQYSTVKYIIQVKTTSSLHATELFCVQDGYTSYTSEYATLVTGDPLGVFSVEITNNMVRLLFDPDNPTNQILKIKMVRYTLVS